MAEFCIDCLNEGLEKKFEEKDFILLSLGSMHGIIQRDTSAAVCHD